MTSATAYYNEIEPFAAQWLRNLIDARLIAPGIVDTRSIEDVTPNDLRGFTQCHFFAGIGVWSHALRMAGWSDNRQVWTGSCPCQPFSQAGKGAGIDDERHLWPHFHWLIQQCKPDVVFGEQVSSKDGLAWIDVVHADLEGAGYTSGAIDTCSAGVGAPHIRQRLYWMAHANGQRAGAGLSAEEWDQSSDRCSSGRMGDATGNQFEISNKGSPESHREDGRNRQGQKAGESAGFSAVGGLDNADLQRRIPGRFGHHSQHDGQQPGAAGENGGLEHASGDGRQGWLFGWQDPQRQIIDRPTGCDGAAYSTLEVNGFWRDADWLYCRDGYFRPVEAGTFPLAPSTPGRVGQVRAYGNAITAEVARVFIETYNDFLNDRRRCDPAKARA